MKFLFTSLAFLIIASCNREPKDFKGFGQLELGSEFGTLANDFAFDSSIPNEHFISEMDLSDGLGKVANVNITTREGKISEVRFTTTPSTNAGEFQKILSGLDTLGMPGQMSAVVRATKVRAYLEKKDSIFVAVTEKDKRSGFTPHQYTYQDMASVRAKIQDARKRMGLK